jgi:hypothetical protein
MITRHNNMTVGIVAITKVAKTEHNGNKGTSERLNVFISPFLNKETYKIDKQPNHDHV